MNIIQTTTALSPEFGGPARTVTSLSLELAEKGIEVCIVYLDFGRSFSEIDLPEHEKLSYLKVPVSLRYGLRPLSIPKYQSRLFDLVKGKEELIFHDNGIWLPYSGDVLRTAKLAGGKVMTTIHGMLEPWAMNYHRTRKLASWHLFQKRRLLNNTILHATSAAEARNLQALGLDLPITVIPNGTEIPAELPAGGGSIPAKKTILFLSRIHPKKGLLNFIRAYEQLRPQDWQVVIAGYDEDGYQKVIQGEVERFGLSECFSFPGPIPDEEKWDLYRSSDLFILPSHSENFGVVIAEALASGTPVLTTRGTPWKDVVDYNCGWWVEPTVPGLLSALQEVFSLSPRELSGMGEKGRQLIEKKYSWSTVADHMIEVYTWLLDSQSKRPGSIV